MGSILKFFWPQQWPLGHSTSNFSTLPATWPLSLLRRRQLSKLMSVHAILITANYHIASHNRSARRRRSESRFSFSCGALDSIQCLNAAQNDVINQSECTEIKAVSQSTTRPVGQLSSQSGNLSIVRFVSRTISPSIHALLTHKTCNWRRRIRTESRCTFFVLLNLLISELETKRHKRWSNWYKCVCCVCAHLTHTHTATAALSDGAAALQMSRLMWVLVLVLAFICTCEWLL